MKYYALHNSHLKTVSGPYIRVNNIYYRVDYFAGTVTIRDPGVIFIMLLASDLVEYKLPKLLKLKRILDNT